MSNDGPLTDGCPHNQTGICIECIIQQDTYPGRHLGRATDDAQDPKEQGPAQEIRERALREIPDVATITITVATVQEGGLAAMRLHDDLEDSGDQNVIMDGMTPHRMDKPGYLVRIEKGGETI